MSKASLYIFALRRSLTIRAGLAIGLAVGLRAATTFARSQWGDSLLSVEEAATIRMACDLLLALAIPAAFLGVRRALGFASQGTREDRP